MNHQYRDGDVQRAMNKLLPIALMFDDDSELDVWAFAEASKHLSPISLDNIKDYLVKETGGWKKWNIGGINNEPSVIKEIINMDSDSDLPTYIIFISDGGIYKEGPIKKLMIESSIIKIPPFKAVTNYEEFIEAYDYVKNSGFEVCIKPTEGIGAIGYKRIIEDVSPMEELSLSNVQISYNHLKKILGSTSNFDPLLVSGVLPGHEWSIDCLSNNGKLVDSVIRIKSGKYEQTVKVDKEINIIVEKLVEKFKLNNLFNIQFKLKDDVIYLLEINTRMSAGIFKSCKIGMNFLHKAILKEFDYRIKSEMYNLKDIKIITNTKYKVEKI